MTTGNRETGTAERESGGPESRSWAAPRPVVVKVGGSVLAGDGMPAPLAEALADLQRRGTPLVVVHGGGSHVTDVLERLGLESEFVDGLRVTSSEVMEVVEMVLAGRVNKSAVSALQDAAADAVGVSGKDGGTLRADPHPSADRLGLVGTVSGSDTRLLRRLLDGGFLPVVCSVAGGSGRESYNVNADEAAAALAGALEARRLVLLTDVPGVLRGTDDSREVVAELSMDETRDLLESDEVRGGMRPKLRACLRALEEGVGAAHVLGAEDAFELPAILEDRSRRGTVIRGEREVDEPGNRSRGVAEESRRYLLGTYRPVPVAFRAGRGARLVDLDGREYLDFIAGIAVSSLGHGHPALVEAVSGQVSRYLHVSNLYEIPEQVEAARLLVESSGLDRAFFCNSGAEAVEGVIKVARRWGRSARGPECHEIVVMEGAFHGRTLGALSATWNSRYREPFEPLTPGFRRVPYNDLSAVEEAVGPETCAVLVEAVQGEGGVIPAEEDYLRGLRELTRENEILLALDEVQTGIGRTGHLFAFEHYGVVPDLVALAKGLGGGVPVGAVLAASAPAGCIQPGDHATTFGGNALSSAAVVAVLRTLLDDGGLEHAEEMSGLLRARLEELVAASEAATGVRGLGLLLALEVAPDAGELARRLVDRGLLVNALGDGALRLAPPLVVTEAEIDEAAEILYEALEEASD